MSPGIRDLVTLSLVPGLGSTRLAGLLARGPAGQWLSGDAPGDLPAPLARWRADATLQRLTLETLERIDVWLDRQDGRLLVRDGADWPGLLSQIPDPPPFLFVRGRADVLDRPILAIVGARDACGHARTFATRLAEAVADCGWLVLSGLARGVDAAAHRGAMRSGVTAAVMATGIDRLYPARHSDLARQMLDTGGCLISEWPPGTRMHKAFFPRRNRLISGMASAVVLVQAAEKSGSMITARCAMEQNRDLFIPPFPFWDVAGAGGNRLISEGATPVQSVQDTLALLGCQPEPDQGGHAWLAHLDSPVHPDALAGQLQLPVADILAELLNLEMDGLVRKTPGGFVRA
jgi:DNA processing protein